MNHFPQKDRALSHLNSINIESNQNIKFGTIDLGRKGSTPIFTYENLSTTKKGELKSMK